VFVQGNPIVRDLPALPVSGVAAPGSAGDETLPHPTFTFIAVALR